MMRDKIFLYGTLALVLGMALGLWCGLLRNEHRFLGTVGYALASLVRRFGLC